MKRLKELWEDWYTPDNTDWEAEKTLYKYSFILCLGLILYAAYNYFK